MLIRLQYWEDEAQHVVNEMIKQVLIAVIDLDDRLMGWCHRTVGKLEEVEVDWLLSESLPLAFEIVTLYPALFRAVA